jgi:hypothetical protein
MFFCFQSQKQSRQADSGEDGADYLLVRGQPTIEITLQGDVPLACLWILFETSSAVIASRKIHALLILL